METLTNKDFLIVVHLPYKVQEMLRNGKVSKEVVVDKLIEKGVVPASTQHLLWLFENAPAVLARELVGAHSVETISGEDSIFITYIGDMEKQNQLCVKKKNNEIVLTISEYIKEVSGELFVNAGGGTSPTSIKILAIERQIKNGSDHVTAD